jgi:hypothetical protein
MVPGYKTFHFMGPEDLHRRVFEAKGRASLDEWALAAFRLKLVHDGQNTLGRSLVAAVQPPPQATAPVRVDASVGSNPPATREE